MQITYKAELIIKQEWINNKNDKYLIELYEDNLLIGN